MTAHFLTDLELRLVDDQAAQGRGLWELISDLEYYSEVARATFVVSKGFQTDLESVPRVPVVFTILGDRFARPAALHDALYAGEFPSISREMADKILEEAILATGGNPTEAKMVYEGVRAFGESHWWKK